MVRIQFAGFDLTAQLRCVLHVTNQVAGLSINITALPGVTFAAGHQFGPDLDFVVRLKLVARAATCSSVCSAGFPRGDAGRARPAQSVEQRRVSA